MLMHIDFIGGGELQLSADESEIRTTYNGIYLFINLIQRGFINYSNIDRIYFTKE